MKWLMCVLVCGLSWLCMIVLVFDVVIVMWMLCVVSVLNVLLMLGNSCMCVICGCIRWCMLIVMCGIFYIGMLSVWMMLCVDMLCSVGCSLGVVL